MNSFNSFSSKVKAKMEEAKRQVESKLDERRKNADYDSESGEEDETVTNNSPNRKPSVVQSTP